MSREVRRLPKVLLVDDGERYAELAHALLRDYAYATRCELPGPCWTCPRRPGCALTHAHDWGETEQALARHPDLDVVLLDIRMPGRDGMQLAAALRLTLPPRSDQELRLERRAFPSLPGVIPLPRGLQPAVAVDLSVREHFPRLTLAQGFLYESPRADQSAVSPVNLEGHKLNLGVTAQLNLSSGRWTTQRVWLSASLGSTLYLFGGDPGGGFRTADGSSWAQQCRAANLDLAAAACLRARDGWALPTASGDYQLLTLQGSLGLHVKL